MQVFQWTGAFSKTDMGQLQVGMCAINIDRSNLRKKKKSLLCKEICM